MYFLFKMGIFHCYVCLPEGTWNFWWLQQTSPWKIQASQELDQALRAAQGALACYKAGISGENPSKGMGMLGLGDEILASSMQLC